MSAFIVSPETMQKVVSTIMRTQAAFDGATTEPIYDNYNAVGNDIASKLYAMNQRAIHARYGKCDDGYDAIPSFSYSSNGRYASWSIRSQIECYKAIQCLLYQCAEGNVPAESLYRELEHVGASLAENIVASLPEYQKAPWD